MLEEAIEGIDALRREVRAEVPTAARIRAIAVLANCVMELNALKVKRDTRN